eukprot:COSAG05_NODE_2523_length_2946_cov_5.044335_2_plen_59_part_00
MTGNIPFLALAHRAQKCEFLPAGEKPKLAAPSKRLGEARRVVGEVPECPWGVRRWDQP